LIYIPIDIPWRCWHKSHFKDIFIGNTSDFQTNCITNFPLNFTANENGKLRIRYGITVRQYALTDYSYNYWKGSLENSNLQGSINNTQPYQLIGNIKNVDNPEEKVFGIFEASAVKSMSLLVDKAPEKPEPDPLNYCIGQTIPQTSIRYMPAGTYARFTVIGENPYYIVMRNLECIFCEGTGGTSIMPEYWDEK
jgi:hypothetical protein